MASSKKSLTDKFAMEAKQKSPGKKSKKASKVSKSLSRELTKAPASPSSSKRAQKSSSDSLVVATRDRSSESPSRTGKATESSGAISKVLQKKDEVMKKVKGKKDGKQITQPSSRDCSPAKTQILSVEKLETPLETTWHKPKDTSTEIVSPVTSLTSSSISNMSSTAECSSISSNIMSSTDSSGLTDSGNTPYTVDVNSSLSDANSSLSDVFIPTTTATVSPIPLAQSTDSLASEMESYKLGMARSSGSFSSDLETIKLEDSVCESEEINMSECSSTSTPVRFNLPADQDKVIHAKRPPKFSLIRDTSRHMFSSSYSPPTSGLRPIEARHRLEELSDEGESPRSYRELSEHDELDVHCHSHFVPLNKQLQIVTSMERLLDRSPRRRSHSPPKDQGLLHQVSYRLPFVDFMKRNGLSTYIYYLPADMTMDKFRHLTRDMLVQQYNIVDPGVLERLQKAIRRAKEEDTTDEEMRCDAPATDDF